MTCIHCYHIVNDLYVPINDIHIPKSSAAFRCLSGQAGAVNVNTAGAETMTDKPWG